MSKTLLSKDKRTLKQRLKDFAKGSDNFSRMGKNKLTSKDMLKISGTDAGLKKHMKKKVKK